MHSRCTGDGLTPVVGIVAVLVVVAHLQQEIPESRVCHRIVRVSATGVRKALEITPEQKCLLQREQQNPCPRLTQAPRPRVSSYWGTSQGLRNKRDGVEKQFGLNDLLSPEVLYFTSCVSNMRAKVRG